MNCTISDLNLSFDKDNKLRSTIGRVTGWDINKAYIFAAQLQSPAFKKYLSLNLTENDIHKDATVDINNIQDSDYVNIDQNKLGSLLNAYYLEHYHSVDNTKTNKAMGRLMGFSSSTAKKVAKEYIADEIIDKYQIELNKPRENRKETEVILNEVRDKINDEFYKRADDFATNILSTDKYSNNAKNYAQHYKDVVDKGTQAVTEYNAENKWLNNTNTRLIEMESIPFTAESKKEYDSLKKEYEERKLANRRRKLALAQLKRDKKVIALNLLTLFGSNVDGALAVRNRNFANLYTQLNGNTDEFLFEVFNTKKMTTLIKEYVKIGSIDEFIEEEDINNDEAENKFNNQTVDETSKSWEDNLYKNFNQTISTKMKFILSRVPKLDSPFNNTAETQAFDTNNELGVASYYDSQYLTVQIHAHADLTDIESFISSLEEKSKTIKALYGLGKLVNDMKQDATLAKYVYANFAKPIVNKVMVTINDVTAKDGIVFDYSNPNAFGNVKIAFDMMNKLRATYNNTYNKNDVEELNKLYKSTDKDINTIKEEFRVIIAKYFPNFDTTTLDNIARLSDNKKVMRSLIKNMMDIISEVGNIKTRINNRYDAINKNFDDAVKQWDADYIIAQEERRNESEYPQYPKKEEFDVSLYELTPKVNQNIIRFANTISRYNESRARMNTANAEGNTASDVIKNCFITRFFDMIMAETLEDSEAGLKAFGNYLTQGTENGKENQYSNNPIFFGLKDENGVVIAPGMFTKTPNGFIINPNAKDILKYALFDGVKNANSGVGTVYDKMSKIDFFITQYIAFNNSVTERTENGNLTDIGNLKSAVYPMRIGSDAPKIFMIRAPKYNRNQAEYAFYNHFMNEMTMFVQAINNLFTNEGGELITKKSIDGLIGRAYFDEKTASKIRSKGGTDFTEAIVKEVEIEIDGKKVKQLQLVGNMFKFLRLFDTTNYSFGKEIERVLSLYGGVREGVPALFAKTADGRLKINKEYINRENSFIIINEGKVELNLSPAQRKEFMNMTRRWVTAYLEDANAEIADYVEALNDQNIANDSTSINSFLLNTAVMNMNYDDMFEGDFKYYNNARDFLKRTKETQAGGDSYDNCSAVDWTNEITNSTWNGQPAIINIKQEVNGVVSKYECPIFDGKTINPKGTMIARNGWRAVTIYNTIKPADEADELQRFLEEEFISQGIDAERAHNRSVEIAKGYWENTTANDAQSYITLEEFIRRKEADGTLDEYQDLLAQLLDPNISADEIDLSAINARIQVQKNFYYDKVFDADTGQFIPRQIKNAEFVLIPKLLPKDSDLIKIYEWMRKNDIGQLNTAETDKAAKKNIFAIWNEQTGEFDEQFESKFNESYIQNYKYKYLYKQQDVPQHMINEENKLGSQISKKIVDNISTASKEVQTWAKEYEDAYVTNIREDYMNFLDAMGWELDSSGKIVNAKYATTDAEGNPLTPEDIESNRTTLNLTNYYARARQEAVRLGMDSNFMEYLIPDEFGKPVMPNAMNNVQQKLESVGQALFNRAVTRQTLPGWHAAQITGIGYSKKLKFNPKTGVMEVYLPRWSKLIPKGKTPEENEAILKQIQEEGLDIHLGYRIPTEGKQSISVLRVVGFTNDALGSTIVVPDAWVTQTGSDFDVDSIYGICYELYQRKGKDGKITVHKIPYEEDTVDNRMLYVNYVNARLDNKVQRNDLGEEIDSAVKEIKARLRGEQKEANVKRTEFDNLFKEQDAIRNEIYETRLPRWARGIIKDINKEAKKRAKADGTVVDLTDAYPKIAEMLSVYLDKHNLPVEEVDVVHDYLDQQTTLLNIINAQRGLYTFNKEDYFAEKTDAIQQTIEANINAWLNDIETEAAKVGIISFEEFKKLPFVERLGRKARNNYILDRMIKIMNDASSREEQYGRSQFEDIAGEDHSANDIINKISGTTSKLISPYNPLTQLDYFDDAMGGAGLKARSVNWDTMASKSNRAHAELSDEAAVYAVLNLDGVSAKDSAITYDEADITSAYDTDVNSFNEPKQVITEDDYKGLKADYTIQMKQSYGNEKRDNVNATTTINAIRLGERTATTRYAKHGHIAYLQQAKVGDIIKLIGADGSIAMVKVTKPLTKLGKNTSAENWSKKEGWNIDHFNRVVKPEIEKGEAYQIEFEYIVPNSNIEQNVKHFNSRKEMLNGMFNDADAFIGEVSQSPYTKQGNKFVVKQNTEVEKMVSAIAKRGIPENRKNDLLSKESIDYLKEEKNSTNYYNIGYSSNSPEIIAVTNRTLYDENYIPKTIAYLRDTNRLNEPVIGTQLGTFKNTSTFLVDSKDIIAINYFEKNGYKYEVYDDGFDTSNREVIVEGVGDAIYNYKLHTGTQSNGKFTEGGDSIWAKIAKDLGIEVVGYSPNDLKSLTIEEKKELENAYKKATEDLGRPYLKPTDRGGYLVRRDYLQAKYGDAIFAIGHILYPGEINKSGYRVRAKGPSVDGGTGYAVQMGINMNKPVHVFDYIKRQWYIYDYTKQDFVKEFPPKLTPNFTGVGTRDVDGIDWIESTIKNIYLTTKNGFYGPRKDTKQISDTFTIPTSEKQVIVKFNKFGWSNNNKNIVGKFITTYTSQTTAHHLDAVKRGSIPNVNAYTFDVYKFITCVGLDHEFSVGFMRQPIISRLVANYNLTNSVYFGSSENPIDMTIADIAADLGLGYQSNKRNEGTLPIDKHVPLGRVITALKQDSNFVAAFNNIFGIDISEMENKDIMNIKFPLRKDYIFQRIKTAAKNKRNKINKSDATAYNEAAVDLSMLIMFKQMYSTAQDINNIIQFSAVDKVGAKPSNRETRRVYDSVEEYRGNYTLKVGKKSWADALFPKDENGNINVDASTNKPIAAAYACATIPSIQVGKQVFTTENDDFIDAEKKIQKIIGRKFNEQEYKEWRRYGMTYLYNGIGKLLQPLMVDERGRIVPFIDQTELSESELKTANRFWDAERSRILGYGIVSESNFTVADINKPTAPELAAYVKLTPAQKVLFIQRNFPDNQGIFNYIKVTLLNNTDAKTRGITRQYLSYDDQVDSIEDLLQFFRNSFSNHNKLIKLACVDLIKYAFIAEGFNFRSSYITKTVPNDTLYTDINQGGMDIINNIDSVHPENNGVVRKLTELPFEQITEDYINKFVRSHSDLIKTINLGNIYYRTNREGEEVPVPSMAQAFRAATRADSLVVLDNTTNNPIQQALIDKLKLKKNINGYIKVDFPIDKNHRDTRLYYVIAGNPVDQSKIDTDYKDYYLIPLNLLEKYETYDVSYNEHYNKFNTIDYYYDVTDKLEVETESRRTANSKNAVADANRTIKPIKQTIGTYHPSTGDLQQTMANPMALQAMVNSSDAYLAGGAKMLTDAIQKIMFPRLAGDNYNAMLVLDNNSIIAQYLPEGQSTIQTITDQYGNEVNFTIAHLPKKSKIKTKLKRVIDGDAKFKTDTERYELTYIVNQLKDTATSPLSANIYRISVTPRTEKEQDDNIKYAATVMIDDTSADSVDRADIIGDLPRRGMDIDNVSAAIIKQITYDARKNNSDIATNFVRSLDRRNINKNFRSSLTANRANIYTAAARYYQSAANELINKLNSFHLADGDYDMGTEEFYTKLAEYPEYFPEVAKIILDAVTFGNRVDMIFDLDIATEDKETKDAIESIRRSINSLRTNTKVRMAMNNLINIYFKRYSTNPMITEGLMNIRDQFGDIDTAVKLIADPTEINNNEVQIILKEVYTMFSRAEMFETQRNIEEWKKALAEIDAMIESLDMDKILDKEHWMLRQDFNDKYLEARNKVIEEYNQAKNHRFDSVDAYGVYLQKQYARDKFMYEHTEQPIIADYYKEDLENRQTAMERGGKQYIEYRMLSAMLYEANTNTDEHDAEAKNRVENIKTRMANLKSITNAVGAEKPPHLKQAAEAINNFLTKRRDINEKYFNHQEYDGFQETYQRYNSFIKSYDAKHDEESLEVKLENAEYREAYEWIKNNGHIGFTKEASDKLAAAFKTLLDRTTSLSTKTKLRLKNIEGAIDESGTINPTVLTDEQIELLKQEEESELSTKYTNGDGEMILIKDVPKNIPLRFRKKKAVKYKQDPDKAYTIGRVNEIISKAVNHDTGRIDIATLFNNEYVTDEEREELARLYEHLYDRGVDNSADHGVSYSWEVNETAYNAAMNYYNTNLKNTKQGKQFLRIVTHLGVDGKVRPNLFLYGYKVPFEEFVDPERTDAFNFIQNNVEFIPTEYYYQALRKASDEGRYDEWFNLNHVYNPFTHKYEPLKIWTTMKAKSNSELAKSVEYIPSFDNMERSVKSEYINNAENRKRLGLDGEGYKEFGFNYKRGDSQYDSTIKLNAKEQAMKDLIQQTLNKYATTYQGKRFVGQGYLPRERETQVNGKWALGQIATLFGASWHSGADSDSFHESVDYSHDREAEMNMLQLLKDKGSKKYKKLPNRADFKTNDEYEKELAKVREENRKIAEENRKIDNSIVNRDFRKVMEDFVYNATIFNSRQAAKPYLYLLLEDLAVNNAYMIKGLWNKKLVRDYDASTSDDPQYRREKQVKTRELVHNLARRLLFNQYHDKGIMRQVANFMQNLTSAKYMIFNLYGGVANVATGKINIAAEEFANEYFGFKDFATAERRYLSNSLAFISSMFTDKAPNMTVALCKEFHVVDFDQVLQFGATSDNLDARMKQVRNFMYSFQSMGEHFMQNSVLLAMLQSNRLYTDSRGNVRIGDFKDFTWDVEYQAMCDVLANHPDLLLNYQTYIDSIRKYNIEDRLELSMGHKDLQRNFLYSLRDSKDEDVNALYKKIANAYHKKREELMKTAKEQFVTNPTVESLYEFKDGKAVLKADSYEKLKGKTKDPVTELERLVAGFREKVKPVNKKIHGAYDKNAAALIESKWWGSIVMQYHKHLPTGIWKRWRRKGYYSEFRGSMERGYYQTFIDFLGTEFTNFKSRRKALQENGTGIALASLQVTMEAALNTIHNLTFNWNNLSNWERANMKRNLAEISGILVACLVVMALYGLSDDDDINDDRFKASLLYLADRLYSETTMYGPVGLTSEFKTNWSNPVASMGSINDLVKAMILIPQALFDPGYEAEYQNGRYAGENKFEVLLKRNTAGFRNFDRIMTIDKNNSYYKVGKSQIGINIAEHFGNMIAGRKD